MKEFLFSLRKEWVWLSALDIVKKCCFFYSTKHIRTQKSVLCCEKLEFFFKLSLRNCNSNTCKVWSCVQCVQGITLKVLFPCAPIPEQKPKTQPRHPAQHRRPGRPPFLGLPGVVGDHVWGRSAHKLYPWQPGPCQPACCAISQPDEGPLTRYAGYKAFWVDGSLVSLRKCFST